MVIGEVRYLIHFVWIEMIKMMKQLSKSAMIVPVHFASAFAVEKASTRLMVNARLGIQLLGTRTFPRNTIESTLIFTANKQTS